MIEKMGPNYPISISFHDGILDYSHSILCLCLDFDGVNERDSGNEAINKPVN